jgi:hypothetical protein
MKSLLVWKAALKPLRFFGDGDDDERKDDKGDKDLEYRQRRQKELEGITLEAAKTQIIQFGVDAKRQRDEIRALKEQLKGGEAEKAELEAYRKLGKADEVAQALEEAAQVKEQVAQFEREKLATKAAGLAKYKPETLAELVKLYKLEVEIATESVTKDGKTEQVEVAKVKGADGKPVALTAYVEAHLKHFLPALTDTADTDKGTPGVPQDGGEKKPQPSGPFAALQQQQEQNKPVHAFDFGANKP